MAETPLALDGKLEWVSRFVREELCNQNRLEVDAFPMSQRVVTKQGNPIGIYFCMHGPRSVRLGAIWDWQRSSVIFYDSMGRRASDRSIPT
jgi:hypothetical protein